MSERERLYPTIEEQKEIDRMKALDDSLSKAAKMKTAKQINQEQVGEITIADVESVYQSRVCPPDCKGNKLKLDAINPDYANLPQATSLVLDCETCKSKVAQEIKSGLEESFTFACDEDRWQAFWKERGL